eukprot:453875-Alexandrium_andersonii.AAC.1
MAACKTGTEGNPPRLAQKMKTGARLAQLRGLSPLPSLNRRLLSAKACTSQGAAESPTSERR